MSHVLWCLMQMLLVLGIGLCDVPCTCELRTMSFCCAVQMLLGAGEAAFNDPTATLLLQIDCLERGNQELR